MDITLSPTKLNGTINARPSAVYSLLHATCQSLALHQVRTGASDPAAANAARAKDYTRLPGCWSKDLEVVLHCFESLSGDAPTLFCADNLNAFSMVLPIAALSYVLNAVLAKPMLGETVSLRRWVGTVIIVSGVVTVIMTGKA